MASKRNLPALKSIIASPHPQVIPQKSKTPPPSPPPSISLKELQDALKANFLQYKEELDAAKVEIKAEIEEKNAQIRLDIIDAFTGLALNVERIDFEMEDIKQNTAEVENRVEVLENELAVAQYHEMEFAIRIRGLRENSSEDLKTIVTKDIANNLGWKAEYIGDEIEKIFRVNSRMARQRNLPRDVVIYFSRKTIRNEIIQAFYKQRFQIAAQDVLILKEIPLKILRGRKHFSFLSDELKRRQIQFRWEIPVGISLNYDGIRYRLLTVAKAKEFFSQVLKASRPVSPQLGQSQQIQQGQQREFSEITPEAGVPWSIVAAEVGEAQKSQQSQQTLEIKEQRMTRAAYRRKEKETYQKSAGKNETTVTTEPVGGARPKRPMAPDLQVLLQRLQAGPDGQVPDLEC